MKREKIEKVLDKAVEKRGCVNCTMKHEDAYFNFIPLCRRDDFVLAAEDRDFMLDGYVVFTTDNIDRIDMKEGIYNYIMRRERVSADIKVPMIALGSYREVFDTFLKYGIPVSIYTKKGFFIGNVIKAGKNNVKISYFDAGGKRFGPVKISYNDIYLICFGNRYTDIFSKYAEPFTGI